MEQLISQKTLKEQEKAREAKEALTLQILERVYQLQLQSKSLNRSNLEKQLEHSKPNFV